MADIRTLKKNWLLDAEVAAPGDIPGQITWLKQQRAVLSPAVREGDWQVTNQSRGIRTTAAQRGISGEQNLKALIAAIEQLEAENGTGDTGGTGQLLSFRIQGIQS